MKDLHAAWMKCLTSPKFGKQWANHTTLFLNLETLCGWQQWCLKSARHWMTCQLSFALCLIMFDACTSFYDKIKSFIADYATLSHRKTGALKDRHWKTILQKLNIQHFGTTAYLKTRITCEIIQVAQGGMIETFWMKFAIGGKQELELVFYQNRARLIRGWDDLFAALDDHTGGLYWCAARHTTDLWENFRKMATSGKTAL